MKMQENIIKKVREYEYKRGIDYAKTDSAFYKRFRICYFIVLAFVLCVNGLILLGDVVFDSLTFSGTMQGLVMLYTAFLIASLVVSIVSKAVWAHAVVLFLNIGSGVGLCFAFSKVLRDELGLLISKFYYFHLIPLILLALITAITAFIAIRAYVFTRRTYDNIVEEYYHKYQGAIEENKLTDKEWNELLKKL